MATEAAKQCLGERFYDQLKGILYSSHPLYITDTHKAIAAMVWPEKPRISAVLTYNFDDLLEKAVWDADKKFKAYCSRKGEFIFQKGYAKEDEIRAIDIFHVHGFVPDQMIVPKDIDLVFSEKEYEIAYGINNSITQLVPQTYLSNSALGLVLGSSLTYKFVIDQLKSLHDQNPGWYHYVIMRPDETNPDEYTREDYRAMGLRVIWINDYDTELPQLLHGIAEL